MRRARTEQPCQGWGFHRRRDSGWFCQDTVPYCVPRVVNYSTTLICGIFFWKVTVCVCIKITTTTTSVFRWCLQTLWEQQVQKQAGERTSQALGTFPPFPGRRRDFSKLSLRAELLSAGERVTLYISMTSEWLSLLYTLISRDTDL